MIPWELIETAPVPDSDDQLTLYRRGEEYSIRTGRLELMNSRVHGSEDALADYACAKLGGQQRPRLLIGGLGMGYTLGKALGQLGPKAKIEVAELVPAVIDWNRGVLGDLAERPLDDPRVEVHQGDIVPLLRKAPETYDAVVLDVDNGPEGLTRKSNNWLYQPHGLKAIHWTLRPGGVLAVWSVGVDPPFVKRLGQAGFTVEEERVRSRGESGGGRFVIWLAVRQE